GNWTGPAEFRVPRCVKQSPIGPDATFEGLPRLIDGFDNVVVDAISLGACHKIAQHRGLLDATGIGVVHVVAGAWPSELGDHDAFARIGLAELVVNQNGLVNDLSLGETLPIRQNMRSDIVD